MMPYILKRIFLMVPTLIGITLITFFIMKLAPGDPVMLKLQFASDSLSPAALEAELQNTKPVVELSAAYVHFAERFSVVLNGEKTPDELRATHSFKAFHWFGENAVYYFKWMKKVLRLDFGLSFKDKRPVITKIAEALPVTLLINMVTILVVYLVSIPLGIWSARHKGDTLDKIVMVKLFLFYSLPTFWVATMLLMFFAGGEYLNLFPLMGIVSDNHDTMGFFGRIGDVAWHLVLPVMADTLGSFAFLARFSRSNFLDVIRQDYIRTARAKGLSESKVLYKHGLRNALIPFVTLMGTLLPGLLGGSVIIEQIFSIPGMGMLSFEAVLGRDHNVIMGIATISAFLTLVSLFLTDLIYGVVDPRIELK